MICLHSQLPHPWALGVSLRRASGPALLCPGVAGKRGFVDPFSLNIPQSMWETASGMWLEGLDLLAVQGVLKSLLQHHSSKASILQCSAVFTVQLSHPYINTGKTIALTVWTFVGKMISLFFLIHCLGLSRTIVIF